MSIKPLLAHLLCGLTLVGGQAAQAHGIAALAMFRSVTHEQTSDASAAATGAYFTSRASVDEADLYTTGVLTLPGGATRTLTQSATGLEFVYQTDLLADRAAMDAAYPSGVYGTELINEISTDQIVSSMRYDANRYPSSTPLLTGTSFSRLQGMDASAAISLGINPLLNGGAPPDEAWVFFYVYTGDGTLVVNQSFLPASSTALSLAAGTLAANQTYRFDLVFSNRLLLPPPAPFEPAGTLGFDLRTAGSFATAVPEPGSAALLGLGLCAGLLWRRRH